MTVRPATGNPIGAPFLLAGNRPQEWGPPATAPASGARVYLHSPNRRHYLAAVIAPLTRGMADQCGADRVHVTTGWRFGPHFDVRAEGPVDWEAVAHGLAAGARDDAPPRAQSEAEYLRAATMLGRIEAVPPPYLPRRPHGHTELLPPEPSPVWRGPLGVLRAQGLAHLLAPLTAAAGTDSDGALLARVAEAFLALADTHPHGLRFGSFSFRSHAEAFLHWAQPEADYRTAFENRMGKDLPVLEELVERVRDGRETTPAQAWRHAFHACLTELAGHVTDQDLERAAPSSGGPLRRREGQSPFHAAVAASGVIDEPPPWFAGYRLTINLFYQLLPALDVSPVRRFYLCHALAQTVDAVFEETWESRLAAVEAHRAGSK